MFIEFWWGGGGGLCRGNYLEWHERPAVKTNLDKLT